MMYLIVPIVLIWAFVVFPSFRIVVGIVALVGVGLIFVIVQNDKEDQKNRAIKQEQERLAREQERVACDVKRKAAAEADKVNWSIVKAAQIELRDTLLKPDHTATIMMSLCPQKIGRQPVSQGYG